jgi:hypothetical protein
MKNVFFWAVTLFSSYKNRRIGGTYPPSVIRVTRIGEIGTALAVILYDTYFFAAFFGN